MQRREKNKNSVFSIQSAYYITEIFVHRPITGASMNPARSLGPAIVSGMFKNVWIYIVSPIMGAATASLVYSVLRLPKPDNLKIEPK